MEKTKQKVVRKVMEEENRNDETKWEEEEGAGS